MPKICWRRPTRANEPHCLPFTSVAQQYGLASTGGCRQGSGRGHDRAAPVSRALRGGRQQVYRFVEAGVQGAAAKSGLRLYQSAVPPHHGRKVNRSPRFASSTVQ